MLAELFNLLLLPFLLLRHLSGRRRASPEEIKRFYKSAEWKKLRYAHLAKSIGCLACGRSAKDGARKCRSHQAAAPALVPAPGTPEPANAVRAV